MIKLSENIANLRKEKSITQEQLASALNVTNQAVSKWESGKCYPDIELLPNIADFFGVSIDELIGKANIGENNAPKPTDNHIIQTAIRIAEDEGKVYTSLLQLKLNVSYNKVSRIINDMCEQGYIVKDPTSRYEYLYVRQ